MIVICLFIEYNPALVGAIQISGSIGVKHTVNGNTVNLDQRSIVVKWFLTETSLSFLLLQRLNQQK